MFLNFGFGTFWKCLNLLGYSIISHNLGNIIILENFGNNKYYLEIPKLDLFATIHNILGFNAVIESFEVKLKF